MKVLILRPSYVPEISGGTHLAVDLVEDMIANDIEVILVVPAPFRADDKVKEEYRNLKTEKQFDDKLIIHRINIFAGEKSLFSRALRMFLLTVGMFIQSLKTKNVDLIMSHSMPPFLGPISTLLGKIKKVPVLYWEQDIVSESLITTGVASKGMKKKLFYSFAKNLEKISSKGSDHIITISEDFRKRQISMGKPEDKVDVVYNWIDTNQLKPIPRRNNLMFQRYNLDPNNFYVTYCGNLGIPQNVEILVDAAKELQHIKDLRFLIFGNGVRKETISNYINNSGANNIKLLPLQPLEEASHVYSVGEVGVVIGRKGTARNGFPSKTWSIMSAGQAIISCFDIDSELSNFVREGECGIAVHPDDPIALKNAILELYNNPLQTKEYGRNARNYVSSKFSRDAATENIINIAKELEQSKKII
ncbi:glycosyltransferase family 4 protein [Cytobacillus firmus]|uniref:glycosyltransferase family 4 protein n=1 Tax=Cytobacillus firmus TaxID=1399 RepID=UPI001C9660B5|nr:glycosyltransferase family 4 protein [Cytobacillus firmus]MBY6052627.1 glycosyltransferase family 4 protein [Cytobacillus firmus]